MARRPPGLRIAQEAERDGAGAVDHDVSLEGGGDPQRTATASAVGRSSVTVQPGGTQRPGHGTPAGTRRPPVRPTRLDQCGPDGEDPGVAGGPPLWSAPRRGAESANASATAWISSARPNVTCPGWCSWGARRCLRARASVPGRPPPSRRSAALDSRAGRSGRRPWTRSGAGRRCSPPPGPPPAIPGGEGPGSRESRAGRRR